MMDLGIGAKSEKVKQLQLALMSLGYQLPKYGADGQLGHETIDAVNEFNEDHGHWKQLDDSLPSDMLEDILAAASRARTVAAPSGVDFHDITGAHPGLAARGLRPWGQIDAIVLHQTGIRMSDTPKRFETLKAHVGVLSLGRPTLVQVYAYNVYLMHANKFNKRAVGVEINGCFEGIDGDVETAWKEGYKGRPDRISETQIEGARAAVKHIIDTVAAHGGKIRFLFAHRQSSDSRRSDPGSRVWQEVGLWCLKTYGLSDGGPGYKEASSGRPIPKEWDPARGQYPY